MSFMCLGLSLGLNFSFVASSSACFFNFDSLLPSNDMLRAMYPDFDKYNPHGAYRVSPGTLEMPVETDYARKYCDQGFLIDMMHIPKVNQAANAFKVGIGNIFFSNHILEFPNPQLAQKYFFDARKQVMKCAGVISHNTIHTYGFDWKERIANTMDPLTKKYQDELCSSVLFSGFPLATNTDSYPTGLESYTTDARLWGKIVYWTVAQSHTELSQKIIHAITPAIHSYTPFVPLPRRRPLPQGLLT